jgi:hypothetical protein
MRGKKVSRGSGSLNGTFEGDLVRKFSEISASLLRSMFRGLSGKRHDKRFFGTKTRDHRLVRLNVIYELVFTPSNRASRYRPSNFFSSSISFPAISLVQTVCLILLNIEIVAAFKTKDYRISSGNGKLKPETVGEARGGVLHSPSWTQLEVAAPQHGSGW